MLYGRGRRFAESLRKFKLFMEERLCVWIFLPYRSSHIWGLDDEKKPHAVDKWDSFLTNILNCIQSIPALSRISWMDELEDSLCSPGKGTGTCREGTGRKVRKASMASEPGAWVLSLFYIRDTCLSAGRWTILSFSVSIPEMLNDVIL